MPTTADEQAPLTNRAAVIEARRPRCNLDGDDRLASPASHRMAGPTSTPEGLVPTTPMPHVEPANAQAPIRVFDDEIAQPLLHARSTSSAAWSARLGGGGRNANEFRLVVQPIIDLATGSASRPRRCCGGRLPSSGLVHPEPFIVLAGHGLIIPDRGERWPRRRLTVARLDDAGLSAVGSTDVRSKP